MTTPEQRTFAFLNNRDGMAIAVDSCKRYYSIYKAEAKSRKKKYGKSDNFRKIYVKSAWNYRKLLRLNLGYEINC